jgi:putative oxidoreductase
MLDTSGTGKALASRMLNEKSLSVAVPSAISLYRVVVSLLFTCHGATTVLGAFGGPQGGKPPVGQWPGWWAGLIQLACGALVFIGIGEIGTRVAALIASGSMAYAYFTVHQKHALWPIQNGGEPAVMFCWSFLLIAILGPGAWTLFGVLSRTRVTARPSPESS